MYKAVIFDLDGTLIDSLEDLADAVNYGLEKMGYSAHPVEKFRKFVGNGAVKLCQRALAGFTGDPSETDVLHRYFSEYYDIHCADKTAPYEGIRELVNKLSESGIMLAVASNKPDSFTSALVKGIFGDGVFRVVYGKRENRETKPAPDIIYDILGELGLSKNEVILAGDSDVDIMTAQNAGISSVGCTWGFRTREELTEAGADYIADTADDIARIVLKEIK